MGRGRQKAKHTKIARELKAYSPSVNYNALERELGAPGHPSSDDLDKWAEYATEADYADVEADDDDDVDVTGESRRA